jgi:hypothetical protein
MSFHGSSRRIAFAGGLTALLVLTLMSQTVTRAQPPKGPTVTAAPQAPTINTPANLGAKRGAAVELTLTGTNLTDPVGVLLSCPGEVTIPTDNKNGTDPARLRVKVELPADCPIGLHTIRVVTKHSVSNFRPFVVDEFPTLPEVETNHSKDNPQAIEVPVVVTGRTDAEASDYFKFKVNAGQTLTFEVLARRIGSPLDPIIVLHDGKTKRELVALYADDTPGLQSDCRLTHTFKEGGEFLIEVRDTTYRGGADYYYRLRIGDFPGATTAFPVAIQHGTSAKVGFAGPDTADIPAVSVMAPAEPSLAAVYATPKRGAASGWPVPVRLSDMPELTEQEPNNEPAKANKLPVPGGVSARFEKPGDVDHFAVMCKKGVKYTASAMTYEINTPSEVLIRVLDGKGAEVGRSNPAQANAHVEFTTAADGEYVIACEQLNFLSGPNEIYHLAVQPVAGDFTITLALDRAEAAAGDGTSVMATVTRLNGYTGPIELAIAGDKALSGKTVLPAGQTIAFVPLFVKAGTKPGAHHFRIRGLANVGERELVRFGTLTEAVKATLGGIPNPPPELLDVCAVGVTEKPPLALHLTLEPSKIEKGKSGKLIVEAKRDKAADGEISIAPLFTPPNITPAAKPIAKGQTKGEIAVTVAAGAAAGPTPITFRATTKIGGKDYAFVLPAVVIDVVEPKKKEEPKKDPPKKKDEPKKKEKGGAGGSQP